MNCGNTLIIVLKRFLGHFLKIPPLKKILEFQDWKKKRIMKLLQKKKFKPEIKPMIKNLQDELLNLKKKTSKRC